MNTSSADTAPKPSLPPVSPRPGLLRRVFSRRVLGRALAGLLIFLTLIVLFYVEEKVRGRWAWERYKQELASQGFSMEVKSIMPAPVPPEKNFARTPLLQPMYEVVSQQQRSNTPDFKKLEETFQGLQKHWTQLGYQYPPGFGANWRNGQAPDFLRALASAKSEGEKRSHTFPTVESQEKAAELILEGFRASTGPMLDELEFAARQRPNCSFDINLDVDDPFSILLPHLAKFKGLGQQATTRAMAELYLKQADAGFRDTQFAVQVSEMLKDDPFLISYLVSVATRELAINAVWYGLATRQWNSAQIEQLQNRLAGTDMMTRLDQSFNAERVMIQRGIEGFAHRFPSKILFSDLVHLDFDTQNSPRNKELERCLSQLYPKGWFYFESINYQRQFIAYIQPPTNQTRLDPQALDQALERMAEENSGSRLRCAFRHTLLSGMLLPSLGKTITKAMNSQMATTMAATACALERHRLEQGNYPKQLNDLVPKYLSQLPLDIVSGQPLKYQVDPDGSFKLYSLGRNGVDDGGKVVLGKSGAINQEEGDWVWQYPAQSSR